MGSGELDAPEAAGGDDTGAGVVPDPPSFGPELGVAGEPWGSLIRTPGRSLSKPDKAAYEAFCLSSTQWRSLATEPRTWPCLSAEIVTIRPGQIWRQVRPLPLRTALTATSPTCVHGRLRSLKRKLQLPGQFRRLL